MLLLTQQFKGCHIVFNLPALTGSKMWPGVVKQLRVPARKSRPMRREAAIQSSQQCLSVSVSEAGKP